MKIKFLIKFFFIIIGNCFFYPAHLKAQEYSSLTAFGKDYLLSEGLLETLEVIKKMNNMEKLPLKTMIKMKFNNSLKKDFEYLATASHEEKADWFFKIALGIHGHQYLSPRAVLPVPKALYLIEACHHYAKNDKNSLLVKGLFNLIQSNNSYSDSFKQLIADEQRKVLKE